MELQMSFLVVEICLILCAVLFQESAGLSSQSLSVASLLHSIKVRAPDVTLYRGKWRYMLLQNDLALSPTSADTSTQHSEHGTFTAEPDLKALHDKSPAYNLSIESPNSHKINNTRNVLKNHHVHKKIYHFAPKPYHQLPPGSSISHSPSPLPSIKGRISSGQLPLPAIPHNHHMNSCMWLVLSKWGCFFCPHRQDPQGLISSDQKTSGGNRLLAIKSGISSASMSFSSSLVAYTGTAKVFSIDDIERATDNYNTSRKLGEGGFGLVYGGVLDDGRKVAVKVLKRDDQQGSREFLAEVEMLRRLHHRNLVKLIGICPEDHCRCLVYELVPNGSVESHLHGVDKEIAPLDWYSRMKIALGAARGLAYLHEDSSPRVIHRDFKSSNILLEDDYTPKVSDFGLARTAADGGDKHISTHVMGTFGYLAPEYAMTGHLLVKSDVYSYGVVLLELLTGRKPVDLTQPPGQENLVTWARPLLTINGGLETIIDPTLKPNVPLDSVSKVAAIASMCVQPEVSHRPFMGEVVQALKLVCNDFEETKEQMSRSCSQEDFDMDIESKRSRTSAELVEALGKCDSALDAKIALSAVDLKNASVGFEGQESESFRRQFNSAPLVMGRKKKFWQKLKGLSRGSMSEHEFSSKL
ncbi:receptor-like cytoplasmic kinase 176 isoform X3 [Henckelia pumila]|uniref:receptor-like cytoplasmic kinase 176 isoform X3 n=1 Tax=Henckelia pumila TaxID=405737 RepID=UPI003C6E5E1E